MKDKCADAKSVLGHLPDTIYLSKADSLHPYIASRLISIAAFSRRGSGKLNGKFDVLFCDYARDNVSGIMDFLGIKCKYVQLPLLSQAFSSSPLESYFTGYEGIAEQMLSEAKEYYSNNKRERVVYSRSFLGLFEKYYIIFRNMAKEHGIKAFFLTGLVGVCESAILKLSIENNIKVFCCQHGAYQKLWPSRELLKNTMFFASGSEERGVLIRNGISKKNILVTGSPFFDMIAKYRKSRKNNETKITILTQQYVECGMVNKGEYHSILDEIFKKIYEVPGTSIIIRPHPAEKYVREYVKMLSAYGKKFSIADERGKIGLYGSLSKADIVLGFESTAEIEAMMLGKPVITIDIMKESNDFDYKKAALHFKYGKSGLLSVSDIKSQLFDKKTIGKYRKLRENYLNRNFYRIDGKASQRIANFIKKML